MIILGEFSRTCHKKIFGVGSHWKRLSEGLLMKTHNISYGEIRKIISELSLNTTD